MSYCELTDILERIPEDILIQLTDDAGSGELDTDQVDAATERADAEIDTWCGTRYLVPFAAPVKIVREISADIAAALLYGRRGADVPEAVQKQAKAARDLLKAISEGKVKIGGATGADPETGDGMQVSAPDRLFSDDFLGKY